MARRTSRRAAAVALTLALLGTAGLVIARSPAFSQASNGPSAAPGPTAAASQGVAPAGRAARWNSLLRGARDLGASRAATAEVLVTLRADRRPSALLSWAVRAGLRATWFAGQPAAMLTARPAVLGAALGVRIDDFRLPGYGVFYASRASGHVPARLGDHRADGLPHGHRVSWLAELDAGVVQRVDEVVVVRVCLRWRRKGRSRGEQGGSGRQQANGQGLMAKQPDPIMSSFQCFN